ncbi:MAG: sortase, partial [Clostridiales bacterium]|nr:sortase [Clostridiales bacterium]
MRIKRITVNVGRILLVIVFLAGLILLSADFIKTRIRQNVSDEAIEAVESVIDDGGGVITIKLPVTDYLEVHGENGESDTTIKDLLREMDSISSEHEDIRLLGILEIPCIELKEPIWDSCSATALRFGVGRFPQTCHIGDEGTCTLFGHRMESHTIFWNLQSLENYIGEEVIVTTTDGTMHRYRIESTTYVKDAGLDPYMRSDSFDTEHLCLATCGWGQDPNNKNIYRPRNTEFIVICVPEIGGNNEQNDENRQSIQDSLQLSYCNPRCRIIRRPMLRRW